MSPPCKECGARPAYKYERYEETLCESCAFQRDPMNQEYPAYLLAFAVSCGILILTYNLIVELFS